MTEPIRKEMAEHYTWGGQCDGWHLVRSDSLSVIEERMPPGTREQRHHHVRSRQFFYVLAGELTMEVEGREHRLRPFDEIEVAPGAGHQAKNESSADARFLVISSPPAHGDRIVD